MRGINKIVLYILITCVLGGYTGVALINESSANPMVSQTRMQEINRIKIDEELELEALSDTLQKVQVVEENYPSGTIDYEVLNLIDMIKRVSEQQKLELIDIDIDLAGEEINEIQIAVTNVKVSGQYSGVLNMISDIENYTNTTYISESYIEYINSDNESGEEKLIVTLGITSLARPKVDVLDLNNIKEVIKEGKRKSPFGEFFTPVKEIDAEDKSENSNEHEQGQGEIIIEDIPDDKVGSINISGMPGNMDRDIKPYPFNNRYDVTSDWGWREDPFTKEREFHFGVDIGAPLGTSVYPLSDGEVVYADELGSYGKTVIIKYKEGYSSLYAHLNEINTSVGAVVNERDIVGTIGATGRATGNHLHLGIAVNDIFVNPWEYISRE